MSMFSTKHLMDASRLTTLSRNCIAGLLIFLAGCASQDRPWDRAEHGEAVDSEREFAKHERIEQQQRSVAQQESAVRKAISIADQQAVVSALLHREEAWSDHLAKLISADQSAARHGKGRWSNAMTADYVKYVETLARAKGRGVSPDHTSSTLTDLQVCRAIRLSVLTDFHALVVRAEPFDTALKSLGSD
jgi:hypothetical protein